MTDTIDEPAPSNESPADLTAEAADSALDSQALMVLAPDVLADSLGDYLRAWWRRLRGGESGALPIIAGLIVIFIFFDVQSSAFLTATNIVNLFIQAAFIILLGMAELYALILSEIDLSVAFVGAVGTAIALALMGAPQNWPWWAAIIVGLLACAVIGFFQGTIITRLRIPSFVVTLAGLLGWQGVLIYVFDVDKGAVGGVISISNNVVDDLVSGNMTPVAGWILLVVVVALFGVTSVFRTARRRSQGLSAPPLSITILTIVAVAIAGGALVYICNLNRGIARRRSRGVPWVMPFVVLILVAQSFLLSRTKLGRYIYAIGASPEAARRRRHQRHHGPHHRVHALQLHRRVGRRRLRIPARLLLGGLRRWHGGPLRGGRRGDRRCQPVRRLRQTDPPAAGGTGDRHSDQRSCPPQHQHGGHRHRHGPRPARCGCRRRDAATTRPCGLVLRPTRERWPAM